MVNSANAKLKAIFDSAHKGSNYYQYRNRCSLTVADQTAGTKTTPKIVFTHRGSQLTYGASIPKFALIMAVYKLKEELESISAKPKDISGYESAFYETYTVRHGGWKPKVHNLFQLSGGKLQLSDKAKSALDEHSKNDKATWLMLNLGNYIYHQLMSLGVHKHFQLNKTYGGGKYLIPGKGSHYLTSDAAVKVQLIA